MKFSDLLPAGVKSVSIVGGGGKTDLIERLEAGLNDRGQPAIVTTTTHLGRWQLTRLTHVEARDLPEAMAAITRAAAGERLLLAGPPEEKLIAKGTFSALPLEWLAELRRATPDLVFLIEADGSRGRPFKLHKPGEPAMPPFESFVIAVLGLNTLIHPWVDAVHRPELLEENQNEFWPSERVFTPSEVADLINARWAILKPDLLFLNQADALAVSRDKVKLGRELAARLASTWGRVALGSTQKNYYEIINRP